MSRRPIGRVTSLGTVGGIRGLGLLVLTTLLGGLAPTLGQARTTGGVTGRVIDESDRPVAGARISLISPSLQGERVSRTDSAGYFVAVLLPVGPYALTVIAPGKQPVQISLRVQVGQVEPLAIRLQSGPQTVEEVQVVAPRTPLETTALGENFNYDRFVEESPIQERRIEVVARLAPNTSASPLTGLEFGNSLFLSIAGAPYHDTTVLLDGAEISEPRHFRVPTLYLEDAVEEVQVLTAGIGARYGRFRGGVVNAITKSGGNEFDGTFRAEFSKESWNSGTPFGERRSGDLQELYQLTLGGYVLKDRLWFFVGARGAPTETFSGETRGTNEPIVEKAEDERYQIKLRGAPHPNHVIEASYLDYERRVSPLGVTLTAGALAGDEGATRATGVFPRDILTLGYQKFGERLFIDAIATRKHVASIRGGDPALGSPLFDGTTLTSYQNNVNDPDDPVRRDNVTVGASATRVFSTDGWGSHTLEGGVQYVESTTSGANRRSSTGFTFVHGAQLGMVPFVQLDPGAGEVLFNVNATNQINLRWEDLPQAGRQVIENLALYAQDTWDLGRWRLDLGLRWERYDGRGPQAAFDVDADAIAPRVGLTFDVREDLQLQATWGRYFGRIFDGYANFATGVGTGPFVESFYTGPARTGLTAAELEAVLRDDGNWGVVRQVTNPETPVAFLAEDVEAPYADDFNLAVKWGLPLDRGTLTVTYTHRDYEDTLEAFVGGFGIQDIPIPGTQTTRPFDTILWDNAADSRRTYEALTATWDYRPGVRWNLGGNWTYSESTGNVEEIDSTLDNLGTALGTYEALRPQSLAVPDGFLETDVRHRVHVWTNHRFDLRKAGGLVLGGIVRYQSGLPWSRVATIPLAEVAGENEFASEDTRSYQRFFGGRGAERFDDWWSLDLSARYQFPIFRRLQGWIKANVVNVLDDDQLLAFDTRAMAPPGGGDRVWTPLPTFGQARGPEDYQRPRSFLFTLGLRF